MQSCQNPFGQKFKSKTSGEPLNVWGRAMRIGSFNIEKSGESSTVDKKMQVESFVDSCCNGKEWKADLVFLCEIHSALLDTFVRNFGARYHSYEITSHNGGGSNNYIILKNGFKEIKVVSQGSLFGLNRDLVAVEVQSVDGFTGSILLAHFKSGQNGLTKTQIQACAKLGSSWAATGDLNWEYENVGQLDVPAIAHECWNGMPTHESRNGSQAILDWVLASDDVAVTPVDITGRADDFDMQGPDHRPILFDVKNKRQ